MLSLSEMSFLSSSMHGPASFDRVFVGGIPRGTTEPELRAAFALAGVFVGAIEFVVDRVSGTQRGFAFVGLLARIDTRKDAPQLAQLRSAMLHGRALDIQGLSARTRRGPGR